MSRLTRMTRAVGACAAAALLTAGLAGCAKYVPMDDVARTIKIELDKKSPGISEVTCPQDLDATIGASIRCSFTRGEQPADAIATVSAIEGDTAKYDITIEARPIPKSLLETSVQKILNDNGYDASAAACDGELPAVVDKTQTCTVTSHGDPVPTTATVTGVEGTAISLRVDRA